MEKQKLMGDCDAKVCVVNKNKYGENISLIGHNGKKLNIGGGSQPHSIANKRQSEEKRDRSNLMSVISDLFGSKTKKENSFAVSLMTVFTVLVVLIIVSLSDGVEGTPVFPARQHSIFNLSPNARNMRHLPCVSRKTKQEGICMFVIDCLEANGTHLGTCIDRFYFGSCCQMPEQVLQISDNSIDDNSIFGQGLHKPLATKDEHEDKVDNSLNALHPLSSSSSTVQQSSLPSSQKVDTTTKIENIKKTTQSIPVKPVVDYNSKVSEKPNNSQNSEVKETTSTLKPSITSRKPIFSSQKYGATSQKFNTTNQLQSTTPLLKPTYVKNGTRKPYPSTGYTHFNITRRPITTGVFVNNTMITERIPIKDTSPTTSYNFTKEQNQPEIIPILKPIRNTTQFVSITTTSTNKPFNLPSRYTTTSTEASTTRKIVATTVQNNKQSSSKPITGDQKTTVTIETTSEIPYKISTFQSVVGEQNIKPTTQKPATVENKKPFITKKPFISEDVESSLPFGTRLPSSTSPPIKPSTIFNKPISTINQMSSSKLPPSTETFTTSTLTQTSTTQNHFQKPKPTLRPERPSLKPTINTTRITNRPSIQRPQNSTLSNRRTTTTQKPTTLVQKPTVLPKLNDTTINEPTKKPTTIIYRPSVETRPSLKPTYVNQKPLTNKPVSISSQSPQTQTTIIPLSSSTHTPTKNDILQTSTNGTRITLKPLITNVSTSKIELDQTTTPISKVKPTNILPSFVNISILSTSSVTTFEPTRKPVTSQTTVLVTKRPLFKPSTLQTPTKPLYTSTQKPYIVSTSKPPIVLEETVVSKPSTEQPTISTTEKIGLVTWTNYLEPAITPRPTTNTTYKDDDWSPATPPDGWVLLQTVSPSNLSIPTMQPSNTIAPPKKPIVPAKPSSLKPSPTTSSSEIPTSQQTTTSYKPMSQNSTSTSTLNVSTVETTTKISLQETTLKVIPEKTTINPTVEKTTEKSTTESTTKKSSTASATPSKKPVFTVHITSKPTTESQLVNVTEKPTVEFSTFMSVSGSPTTVGPLSTLQMDNKNTTSSLENTTLTGSNTTEVYSNETSTQAGPTSNITTVSGDTTDKSTVSPIEGITSSTPVSTESLNMSDFRDVCGRRLWPEARVVGGSRANFGRWPWQVSLRQWRTSTYLHKCGAALLSENWAVTAAHCVDSVPPSDLLLRLGEHDLASEDEPYGFQERRVQIVASHPQFDPRTFEYDLALLRFYEPVTFQPNILPVCVPTNDEGFVGKTAYVTGWGRLYEDGPLPSVLQEVSVPVLENESCEQMYRSAGYIEHIPHIFICAGWRKGGFDSCEGDSGGPMVLQREDKRFLLAGIISWGIGCAEPNQPGVYTRISEFRDWINQILQF